MKLLFIESSELYRIMLQSIAENIQQSVFSVKTFSEAEQVLETSKDFDLVIVDHDTLGNDGLSFLKKLKQNPKTDSIPVLLLVSEFSATLVDQSLLYVDDYLLKPVTRASLAAHLQTVMNKRKASQSSRLSGLNR